MECAHTQQTSLSCCFWCNNSCSPGPYISAGATWKGQTANENQWKSLRSLPPSRTASPIHRLPAKHIRRGLALWWLRFRSLRFLHGRSTRRQMCTHACCYYINKFDVCENNLCLHPIGMCKQLHWRPSQNANSNTNINEVLIPWKPKLAVIITMLWLWQSLELSLFGYSVMKTYIWWHIRWLSSLKKKKRLQC